QAHPGGGEAYVPPAAGVAGVPGADATRFDLTAVAGDPDATRFDLPAVPAFHPPADPDPTRVRPPPIPRLSPPAAPFDAASFDTRALEGGGPFDTGSPYGEAPPTVVTPGAVPPPAAQPPGSADTRFDLRPVADDLMAAGYQLPQSQTQAWPGP